MKLTRIITFLINFNRIYYQLAEFLKEMDYTCDAQEDFTGIHPGAGRSYSGQSFIVHSNLLDAINDCARSQKCTMVVNHKGYEQDFRLCKGIPAKTINDGNEARRNIIYKKSG